MTSGGDHYMGLVTVTRLLISEEPVVRFHVLSSWRRAIVSVVKKQPILRAIAAGVGMAKKNHACAPLPERDRSIAVSNPHPTERRPAGTGSVGAGSPVGVSVGVWPANILINAALSSAARFQSYKSTPGCRGNHSRWYRTSPPKKNLPAP